MMGERRVDQAALFYTFSLEDHVPANHLLRSIDRFVELEGLRAHLAPFYSAMGRPSIDPELLIRMLLVGYCFGIRSERRLCEEVHLNLAYRWFCRLGLEGAVPDHSTFSKNRHGRFRDSDLLRQLFDTVLRRCMAEGLVGGEGFAVDASLIKAEANRERSVPGDPGLPPEASGRAIDEYLAVLDDAAFGGATPVTPKFISPVDPAARWTAANKGPASLAWQAWDLLQERVRFLGGRIVLSTRPDLPDGVPPEIDDLFTSVEAPDDFYTWAAQHRMNDGSAQSYLQLWNAPALNRATVGVDVGAQLPPSNVVSHEEAVACQALEQVLGYDLAADPEEIDGLRIVEWLRGLSVLSVLAARRAEVDTSNPDAWLIPFDRAELAAVLIRNGLVAQKAELFIDQARFRTSSVDLYDAPLIQSADGSLIGFGPAMVGASAAGALLSIFARKEASFDRKGKSFERRVVDLLKGQGLKVATLKTIGSDDLEPAPGSVGRDRLRLVLCRVFLMLGRHADILSRTHGALHLAFVLNSLSVHLARTSSAPSRCGQRSGVLTAEAKVFSENGLKTSVQNRKTISGL